MSLSRDRKVCTYLPSPGEPGLRVCDYWVMTTGKRQAKHLLEAVKIFGRGGHVCIILRWGNFPTLATWAPLMVWQTHTSPVLIPVLPALTSPPRAISLQARLVESPLHQPHLVTAEE